MKWVLPGIIISFYCNCDKNTIRLVGMMLLSLYSNKSCVLTLAYLKNKFYLRIMTKTWGVLKTNPIQFNEYSFINSA